MVYVSSSCLLQLSLSVVAGCQVHVCPGYVRGVCTTGGPSSISKITLSSVPWRLMLNR